MLPTLFTFRRCPYAMRARWAIEVAGVEVNKHEVSLRNKPAALLEASPKGTVPVLVLPDGSVIDQSLDIMLWALRQRDPEGWLQPSSGTMNEMMALIELCESKFKPHLDRYKYPSRYQAEWAPQASDVRLPASPHSAASAELRESNFSEAHFDAAQKFLLQLSQRLLSERALGGGRPALADFAIVPFVRQMARHDRSRFEGAVPSSLTRWMDQLLSRADFEAVMSKQTSIDRQA